MHSFELTAVTNKICIICGDSFLPLNTKILRCINCHYLYKSGLQKKIQKFDEQDYSLKRLHQSAMRRFYGIKKNAQKRNLDFKITLKQLKTVITQPCYYCNVFKDGFKKMSIDRKDFTLR